MASMNGIDISAWQENIDLSKVPCDFVIVKATEGTGYTSNCCVKQCDKTLKLNKCLGLYHYANGGNVKAEADRFLSVAKKYVGKAIFVLDWESGGNSQFGKNDYAWCKEWCNYVYKQTKVKPFIYIQKSAMNSVKNVGAPLWIAQYPDYNRTGYQSTPWNEGAYSCAIRQYSSVGRLNGYNGDLDLNKAYFDKAQWKKYASKVGIILGISSIARPIIKPSTTKPVTSKPTTSPTASIIKKGQTEANKFAGCNIAVDGIRGVETRKAAVKVVQTGLNKDYGAGLTVDGIWGSATDAAFGSHYVKVSECQWMVTALEILCLLKGKNPKGVEYPGVFGQGLKKACGTSKAVKKTFKDLCS